ncbi:MAG TPA: patatin-like phospholipase family protein [Candidatus Dormibacteraeota bacterium]|nr:patatin-like phospholipase family protein [Candidatus Dormibacteraeota bacterium]
MDDGSGLARERIGALRPPVALCLSGGGARGAAQAGVIIELVRSGLRPDVIVGTSVGAWNGAWLASHPTPEGVEGLATWWADPEVRNIFKGMWLGYAGAIAWRRSAALSAERVETLLNRGFGDLRFEELGIPLTVGATDLLTADLVYFHRGPVAPAVRASSAIPTVLPPVALLDRLLVDGGVIDNFGVHEAVRRGARSIVLIDASTAEVSEPPVGLGEIVDRMTHVSQVHQRRRSLAAAAGAGVPLHLIEAGGVGASLDFQRAEAAVARGRELARAWLDGRPLPPVLPPPTEDRQGLVDRWHVLEERVRDRVSAMPLWRRAGTGVDLDAAEEPEVGRPG